MGGFPIIIQGVAELTTISVKLEVFMFIFILLEHFEVLKCLPKNLKFVKKKKVSHMLKHFTQIL